MQNNNIINKQLNRMKDLMGTSIVSEAQKKAQDPVEYSTMGPDGKYYGIVREGANYYIKSAVPNEKGELIKENFDYIGGFCERKQNEYHSFASAKRNLEGKLYSLKEAIKANGTLIESNTNKSKSKYVVIEAKGQMRADIKRQLEIMNNSQILDEERAGYKSANTLLTESESRDIEATPFTVGDSYGDNFDEKGMPKGKKTGEYKEKVYKGGETIIGQFNEAEDDEEVLDDKDEEKIDGDTMEIDLNDADDESEEIPVEDEAELSLGDGMGEEGELGDEAGDGELESDEFEENSYTIYLDPADLEDGTDLNINVKVGNPDETDEFDDDSLYDEDEDEADLGQVELPEGGQDASGLPLPESRRRSGRVIREANYFGKHPKYLAKPFSTPRAHADFQNTYDWNDESVDNEEEPFTDNQRYKYFSERPQHIENSLGLAENKRRSKKVLRRF